MATEVYFRLLRKLLLSMLACAGFAHAQSAPLDPPEQTVPLARRILGQTPPDDAFEFYILASQLDQIGFHQAAARIQAYGELVSLEKAMGQSAIKARTLRAVVADSSVEKSLAAQARRMAFKDFTIAFYPAVLGRDTIASMPEMDRAALKELVELGPGLWSVSGEKENEAFSSAQATKLYLIVNVRNPSNTKAKLRFRYELSGRAPMNCTIDRIAPHGNGHALCEAILAGTQLTTEGRRVAALTSVQKASILEQLRALQQGGPAPLPGAAFMAFPDLHLEIKIANSFRIVLNREWKFAVENQARQRLRAMSCDDLGACTHNMLTLISGPGGMHAAVTLVIMICLVAYQSRRGDGKAKSFWSSFLKLYAVVVLLAIVINVGDSPSGATRGAPLSGTFGFLARVAVSLPWSYYFGIESNHFGISNRPLADNSPWFWGFAFINLAFLGLMALGGAKPVQKTR